MDTPAHFPNTSKPFDVSKRAFHRINSPNYDTAVDGTNTRRGAKSPPSGLARESGARGPEAFKDSGFLVNVTNLVAKLVKTGLFAIPIIGPIIGGLTAILKAATGTDPIDALFKEFGKLISRGVEGALFARSMRSIPAWVPVGRKGYENQFTYVEDATPRTTNREEEREVEGVLSASYALSNDTVFTQWSHFRHWSFHVIPAPGFRYLIGRGNTPDENEDAFIKKDESRAGDNAHQKMLAIYGQDPRGTQEHAIECLLDIGAISKPVGDRGSSGVMYDPKWPYWPMAGDHFWASGRWAYDCMRAVPLAKTEIFPTQINPIKAFASSRFEGFKFDDNTAPVPAVRFFFFATNEGGFTEFRASVDRNGKTHDSGIVFGDRDYEFIVDLPPRASTRDPYPIGATINFPLNRLVLRPRLLMSVEQAPFGITPGSRTPFADGLEFVPVQPKIELLRPADPTKLPTQARVTIPLSKLPVPSDPKKRRVVGLDISLGWHDPNGEEAKKLFKVTVQLRLPSFVHQGGNARLSSGINGRWSLLAERVSRTSGRRQDVPPPNPRIIHQVEMMLPIDAPVSIVSYGTWRHGFGEFLEGNTLEGRKLFVGGALLGIDADAKKRIEDFIDDARRTVAEIRRTASDVTNPKQRLRDELKKQLDELKASNADPRLIQSLEDQINSMVDGLPDAPDAFRAALGDLDKQLGGILEGLDAIEDFLKITDDLVGVREVPGWHEDIDAAIKTGADESKRVSAIARSMFLRPLPLFNQVDEPMGWAEFVDSVRKSIGRLPVGDFRRVTPGERANVRGLLNQQASTGPVTRIIAGAPRITLVGSGNNLAERIQPPDEMIDYFFEADVAVVAPPA